jgi:hypothetical protein
VEYPLGGFGKVIKINRISIGRRQCPVKIGAETDQLQHLPVPGGANEK